VIRGLVVVSLIACGAPAPSAPMHNRAAAPPASDLVRRAERALSDSLASDLRRPTLAPPYDPSGVRARFTEACRGGDAPSCWKAISIDGGDSAALELARQNCLAHDLMSCRGLPAFTADDAPGAAGRSRACQDSAIFGTCDPRALRRECAAGFAVSCQWLAAYAPRVADWDAIKARIAPLARAGCKAGIAAECRALVLEDSDDDTLLALRQLCTLARDRCAVLGRRYLRTAERARARNAFERACQYEAKPEASCLELGMAYLSGQLSEPVTGRGQALIDWACASSGLLRRIDPGCKRALLPAASP